MAEVPQVCVGVMGGGSIGLRHASNLRSLGVNELVVLEPSDASRARFPGELASVVVAGEEAFWDREPKVIFVCTPSANHLEDARKALARGCDVFIEKPLSVTSEGCASLAAEANRGGNVSMVACNMRFYPGPAAIKRLLEERRVGDVISARIFTGSHLPRWRPWQDYRTSYSADLAGGGAILDCIHEIDLALWYFGPARLHAAAVRRGGAIDLGQTDALAELLLDHESGVLSSLHLNFIQRNYSRGCEIIGSRGTINWIFGEPAVRIYGEDGALAETLPLPERDVNDMYLDEARHFLDCVSTRSASCNPIEGGAAALEIALAARSAAR